MRGAGGNEDGVAEALDKLVAGDSVLPVQPAAQLVVQVRLLVVYRVRVDAVLFPLLLRDPVQEVSNRGRVLRLPDVPHGAREALRVARAVDRRQVAPGRDQGVPRLCDTQK